METYNLIIGLACMDLSDSEGMAEEKYQKIYKPFLRKLYEFPEVKVVIHFSGSLIEWFEDKHPEVIMLIEELVKKRKQVEILGGGYYEPIFPMLSAQDKSGQLESLTTLLRKKFGKRPRGCWIPGSIWDSSLILPIRNSGMDYIFLDYDKLENLSEKERYQPFLTEDNGKLITVFPAHSFLTNYPDNTYEKYFERLTKNINMNNSDEVVSLIFTDKDLEGKTEEWLGDFFSAIRAEKVIRTINPSVFIKANQKLRKKYVQNKKCYKSAIADNYSTNLVYSRMIHVQTLINQLKGDKYKKKSATEFLWAAQNYIPYTDDSYDNENTVLRKKNSRLSAYKNLLEAELLTRQKGVFIPSLFKTDFDLDGLDEYLFHGDEYNAFTHCEGASLFEMDSLKDRWNYCNSLDCLNDSTYLNRSFCDYLITPDSSFEKIDEFIKQDKCGIAGIEFTENSYDRDHKVISFSARIKNSGLGISFKIVKKYKFNKKNFEVTYTIINTGSENFNYCLGIGIFLSMISSDNDKINKTIAKNGKVNIEDSCINFSFSFEGSENILIEDNCESSCTAVLPVYNIKDLEPGKSWETKIEVKV